MTRREQFEMAMAFLAKCGIDPDVNGNVLIRIDRYSTELSLWPNALTDESRAALVEYLGPPHRTASTPSAPMADTWATFNPHPYDASKISVTVYDWPWPAPAEKAESAS